MAKNTDRIVREWRRYCSNRLYWRHRNPRWRDWPKKAIAMTKSGAARTWFFDLNAIQEYIDAEKDE